MKRIFMMVVAAAGVFSVAMAANAEVATLPQITVSVMFSPPLAEAHFGMNGEDVKYLQAALSSWPDIYPSGLVTGYFGMLTRDAVMKFQARYGLAADGSVGPLTLAKLNDVLHPSAAPVISAIASTSVSSDVERVSWTTDVPATTKIYYSTSMPFQATGTTWAVSDTSLLKSHVVDITHLSPSVTYNYVLESAGTWGSVATSSVQSFSSSPR